MPEESTEELDLRATSSTGFSVGSMLGTGVGFIVGPPGAATGFFVGGTLGGVAGYLWL